MQLKGHPWAKFMSLSFHLFWFIVSRWNLQNLFKLKRKVPFHTWICLSFTLSHPHVHWCSPNFGWNPLGSYKFNNNVPKVGSPFAFVGPKHYIPKKGDFPPIFVSLEISMVHNSIFKKFPKKFSKIWKSLYHIQTSNLLYFIMMEEKNERNFELIF